MKDKPSLDDIFGSAAAVANRPSLDDIFNADATPQPIVQPLNSAVSTLARTGRDVVGGIGSIEDAAYSAVPLMYSGLRALAKNTDLGDYLGNAQNMQASMPSNALKALYDKATNNAGLPQNNTQAIVDKAAEMLAGGGVAGLASKAPLLTSGIRDALDLLSAKSLSQGAAFAGAGAGSDVAKQHFPDSVAAPIIGGLIGGGAIGLASHAGANLKAPVTLPDEIKNLQPLLDMKKATVFAGAPDDIQQGLSANRQFSTQYNSAKTAVNNAYTDARNVGDFQVSAPNIYDKLDDITTRLADKVVPGSKEQVALNNLNSIKKNLQQKYSTPSSTSSILDGEGNKIVTPSIPASNVTANDLMDIEQAINAGLPVNKFNKAGDASLLNFKNEVQSTLNKAAKQVPEFGDKYQSAKSLYADMSSTFNNSELKPFWRPEDYISWKAAQNNPNLDPFSDATKTRAYKTLDNLNTKNLGRYGAVLDALPADQGAELMRNAYIKAEQQKVSLGGALASLAHGDVLNSGAKLTKSLLGQGKDSNIAQVVNNLQKSQVAIPRYNARFPSGAALQSLLQQQSRSN